MPEFIWALPLLLMFLPGRVSRFFDVYAICGDSMNSWEPCWYMPPALYWDSWSGFIIDSILLKPWPTRAILSDGSLNGSFPQGMYSVFLPTRSTIPLAQDAHEVPPRGFFVNMGSSSLSCPYLAMNKSYIFFRFFSNNLSAFLVSDLSANCFDSAFTSSLSLSRIDCSKALTVSMSAFMFRVSWKSFSHLEKSALNKSISFSRP